MKKTTVTTEKKATERIRLVFIGLKMDGSRKLSYSYLLLDENDDIVEPRKERWYGKKITGVGTPGSVVSVEQDVESQSTIYLASAKYEGQFKDSKSVLKWIAESNVIATEHRMFSSAKRDSRTNEYIERLKPLHDVYINLRTRTQRQILLAEVITMITSGTRIVE